jgi:hypothetical protein
MSIVIRSDVEGNCLFLRDSPPFLTGIKPSGPRVMYCSSPVGSRKTTRLIERAIRMVRDGARAMILAPTKRLVDQIARDLHERAEDLMVTSMHEDTHAHPTGWIIEHSRTDLGREPQVIVSTHAALPHLIGMDDRAGWHLMVDEALQVVRSPSWVLSADTHAVLTRHLEVGEGWGSFRELPTTCTETMKDLSRSDDDVLRIFREAFRLLGSDGWRRAVCGGGLDEMLAGTKRRLYIHSMLKPSVLEDWASVLIVGARLQDTPMHAIWSAAGVDFVRDDKLPRPSHSPSTTAVRGCGSDTGREIAGRTASSSTRGPTAGATSIAWPALSLSIFQTTSSTASTSARREPSSRASCAGAARGRRRCPTA